MFTSFLWTACGREDQENIYKLEKHSGIEEYLPFRGGSYVHPDFRPYVGRFETLAGRKVFGHAIIDFGDLSDNEAANCGPEGLNNLPVIRVSRKFWNIYQKDAWRELIIFHELGHCFLDLDHTNTWANISNTDTQLSACAPKSIMYPGADAALLNAYLHFEDYYRDELIGRKISGFSLVETESCFE